MKILVDMNLSPALWRMLSSQGWTASHWSEVGDPRAPDGEIMRWAVLHGYIVLTHDLDLGAVLAATRARGPSVLQVRTHDVAPTRLGPLLCDVLKEYQDRLEAGALVVVEEARRRVRMLPLRGR